MAFNLKLDIEITNCKKIVIYDETGLYNIATNPTGWGDDENSPYPTLRRQDVVEAWISIINKTTNEVVYEWDVTGIINPTSAHAVNPILLVQNELVIPDGIYYIKLWVKGDLNGVEEIYEVYYKHYLYCNVKCCVYNSMLSLESLLCDPCGENSLSKLMKMNLLLKTLQAAECKDQECECLNALKRLQRLCGGGSVNHNVKPCNC